MLLGLSGLTREKRVEEQASRHNESEFDKVADALAIQQPRVHLRESRKRPEEKGKDTQRLQEEGKHTRNGKYEMKVCYTNFNFVEDHDHGGDTVERADTYQAHGDLSNLGGDGREVVLDRTVDEKNVTFSPNVVPGDVSTFEEAGPGKIASLCQQDNDLDPEVGAQLGQAYLRFGKEKSKGKAKATGNSVFVHHVPHWIIPDNG